MVKITFKPFEEIVIHEIVKLDWKDLVERQALNIQSGESGALNWANRILFFFVGMEHTDDVVRDQLKMKVHWLNVTFAIYKQYKSQIISSGNIPVPVFDVSKSKIMNEVTKWLYNQVKLESMPF